jgi:hypothetical protein
MQTIKAFEVQNAHNNKILFFSTQFAPKGQKLPKWEISHVLAHFVLEFQAEHLYPHRKLAGEWSLLLFRH